MRPAAPIALALALLVASPGLASEPFAPGSGVRDSGVANHLRYRGELTEKDVRDELRARGYTDIRAFKLQGDYYKVRAMQGARYRDLSIDRRTGAISTAR